MTKWISVDDSLPLVNQHVLVSTTDGSQSTAYRLDRAWTGERWKTGTFWRGMSPNIEQDEVTHWMKLPTPPSPTDT